MTPTSQWQRREASDHNNTLPSLTGAEGEQGGGAWSYLVIDQRAGLSEEDTGTGDKVEGDINYWV